MRRTNKKTIALALSLALVTSMAPGVNVEAAKKKVKLNKKKVTVFVGEHSNIIRDCKELKYLDCTGNQLESIDVTECPYDIEVLSDEGVEIIK